MTEPTTPAAPRTAGAGRAVNLAVRFLLELATLAVLAYWGFHTGKSLPVDLLLGVGAPLAAAVVWGTFAAPKSERRLSGAALTAVQLTVLGSGAVALAAARQPLLAVAFAAVIVVNAVLLQLWGQQ